MPILYPYAPTAPVREVKNLGWLLRHASEVESMTLVKLPNNHAQLRAYTPTCMYYLVWADYKVAKNWLKRRCLKHASLALR